MGRKIRYQVSLPVSFLKEGDIFVAYTPALDLSTSGQSFEVVQKRFAEAVNIFFAELAEKGTLGKVLVDLGWQKRKKQLVPPTLIKHDIAQFTFPATV